MKLNKLNDWVKVLAVQLVAGILTIIFRELCRAINEPNDIYFMLMFDALMIAYYACAGFFLRTVKIYKIILVWGLMLIAAVFIPMYPGFLLSGGIMMFALNFYIFIYRLIVF